MTIVTATDSAILRISDSNSYGNLPEGTDECDARIVNVGSTGVTSVEPLVMITRNSRTSFYANCTPERVEGLVRDFDEASDATVGTPDDVVNHASTVSRLPSPTLPGLDVGPRRILGACGWRRPTSASDHEAAGGFAEAPSDMVLDAGTVIRGRGWGDWCLDEPVGPTWEAVRASDEECAVVVNGHGQRADSLLLESAPFEVLEGAQAVARAVGGDRIVVYTSSDADRVGETVRAAISNYPDPTVPVEVVTGPADYRAAEPTMALEAIEGNDRLEARLRPPGPEEFGLHGQPTLVHTPRTFAHLSVTLREGVHPNTRTLAVTGDVTAPATVELPEEAPLSAALDAVDVDGEFKAACVGDRFGAVTDDLDVAVDPDALLAANLGTEGTVEVLNADRCLVEFVGQLATFASEKNCGRCVPCREGTTQLAELLREIYDGTYDRDGIEELVNVMNTSSICLYGENAGRPVQTAIDEFGHEFKAHADGRCPAGNCLDSLEAS